MRWLLLTCMPCLAEFWYPKFVYCREINEKLLVLLTYWNHKKSKNANKFDYQSDHICEQNDIIIEITNLRSTEHDARTFGSLGDHCKSSTEEVCPVNGRWSTAHWPPSSGFHTWMCFLQSPVAKTPGVVLLQSRANPSVEWPDQQKEMIKNQRLGN